MTERIQENSLTVPVKKEQKERQDFILRAAGLKLRGGRGSHKRAKTEGVGWVTVGDRSKQEGLGGASWGSAVKPLPEVCISIPAIRESLESSWRCS